MVAAAIAVLLGSCASTHQARAPLPDPRPSPACTSSPSAPPKGVSHATLAYGGTSRSYRLFVPPNYRPGRPSPLVVDLPGYNEEPDAHADESRFEARAGTDGAVVVTPRGQGAPPFWDVRPGAIDEVNYLQQLVAHVEATACIDLRRVYVAGFSNGALMASVLACGPAGGFAAFGAVSGIYRPPGCHPPRPAPIVAFHGTADPVIGYGGGIEPFFQKTLEHNGDTDKFSGVEFGPVEQTAAWWAKADRCGGDPSATKVNNDVRRLAFGGCAGEAAVVLYRIEGGGHAWPTTQGTNRSSEIPQPDRTIDATDIVWKFFLGHPLPATP